jgi:16S rRNA (guanine527-N7)-methyltransferase
MGPATDRFDLDRRIEALAERYELRAGSAGQLGSLARLLADDPDAPTSVRDLGKVIDDHLADALVALELSQMRSAFRIVDLGSGAGLPGLPLAIALPETRFALIESSRRKCAFIERALALCGIENAEVVNERIERWGRGLGESDVVTARALAPLDVVVEYAAPLLRVGGTLVAWRGHRDPLAEAAGARAAAELGLRPSEIRSVRPYPEAKHRHLHLMLKVRQTPSRFPRRPGMALKRPLGAL